uniref:Uncharacterized protein n=1 Tax=Glossina brevipalpis TaxID=37001 RepID=A0A1A9WU11_9MUSC
MFSLKIIIFFIVFCLIEFNEAGVIRRRSLFSDDIQKEFEQQIQLETETFLNNIFKNQINYFNKVKLSLPTNSKRVKDIETYVYQLETAIEEKNVEKKDEIYLDTFQSMGRTPLLLNKESDTGLSDEEYQTILMDNDFNDFMKNFLVEIGVYFWKMAKASGKAVETSIDDYLENIKKRNNLY